MSVFIKRKKATLEVIQPSFQIYVIVLEKPIAVEFAAAASHSINLPFSPLTSKVLLEQEGLLNSFFLFFYFFNIFF